MKRKKTQLKNGYDHCPVLSHLPEQRLLVSFLSTIQGSFPCSSKEITAGLELESPDHEKT